MYDVARSPGRLLALRDRPRDLSLAAFTAAFVIFPTPSDDDFDVLPVDPLPLCRCRIFLSKARLLSVRKSSFPNES